MIIYLKIFQKVHIFGWFWLNGIRSEQNMNLHYLSQCHLPLIKPPQLLRINQSVNRSNLTSLVVTPKHNQVLRATDVKSCINWLRSDVGFHTQHLINLLGFGLLNLDGVSRGDFSCWHTDAVDEARTRNEVLFKHQAFIASSGKRNIPRVAFTLKPPRWHFHLTP